MKKIITAAIAAALCAIGAYAQNEMPRPDLGEDIVETVDTVALSQQAPDAVGQDGQAQWFVNMDYAGFEFEIPAGTIVDKGSKLLARYPDGTFGLSMLNEAKQSNQKIAFEVCRRMAAEMKIPNAHVEKVKFGSSNGAKAQGMIEGQLVTLLVLPYSDQQVTTVMLATPNHQDWVDHFLRTLKR